MSTYLWMDAKSESAPAMLAMRLKGIMDDCRSHFGIWARSQRPVVILCIGTPNIPGDRLGPEVGSLLAGRSNAHTFGTTDTLHTAGSRHNLHVFGTLDAPVHALNLRATLDTIKRQFHRPMIVVVDAALGNEFQEGFLAIKKGALRPGSGLGKRLPSIGDIQITGVFCNLYGNQAREQMLIYSQCIANGIFSLFSPESSSINCRFIVE